MKAVDQRLELLRDPATQMRQLVERGYRLHHGEHPQQRDTAIRKLLRRAEPREIGVRRAAQPRADEGRDVAIQQIDGRLASLRRAVEIDRKSTRLNSSH